MKRSKRKGYLALVLHGHLPYVLEHGKWPHGTDWLCEGAAECYLPILEAIEGLVQEGIAPKFTLGITPVLTEQLAHPEFRRQFEGYLGQKIEAAEENRSQFQREGNLHLAWLAEEWVKHYSRIREAYLGKYGADLVGAFARLQEEGHIEIISSASTHGYLPLLGRDECVQAQIRQGLATHQQYYGRPAKGFWLPECAYRPRYAWSPPVWEGPGPKAQVRKGIDEFLSEEGVEYFIVDSHLLEGGEAIGVYRERFEALTKIWKEFARQYEPPPLDLGRSPYRGYLVNPSGEPKRPVAFFVRDPRTGIQVWSSEHGYPGDGRYLEFHKKHHPGGHRYWRVTASKCDLADKEVYEPDKVSERIEENAAHFCSLAEELVAKHFEETGEEGIVCAPYDMELFGHWWFEGPRWLAEVVKRASRSDQIELITCGEYLERQPPQTIFALPEGSWGEGGFHWVWLNEWTEWTWKHVYKCEEEMCRLAKAADGTGDFLLQRLLAQLGRELLLLESSDWQFLITTWHARDYAEMRFVEHYESFQRLAEAIRRLLKGEALSETDLNYLGACEERDQVFASLKTEWYGGVEFPAEGG